MKNLWNHLDKLCLELETRQAKIIMLDFDGTLAPIVKYPQDAKLPQETKSILRNLSKRKRVYTAVISGRRLDDLKEKVGITNLIYAGVHGLNGEVFGKKYSFSLTKKQTIILDQVRTKLLEAQLRFTGTFIEDKELILSFHYRAASTRLNPVIKIFINQALNPLLKQHLIYIIPGKKVFDVVPNIKWNKEDFARQVVSTVNKKTKQKPLIIFIGDDQTDEAVFQKFKDIISVKVGKYEKTYANYYLKDTEDVRKFLLWLNSKI